MKTNKHNYKVTDEQFIEAFRACEGNYLQTAKYIQDNFNIPYTKQSVQERAEKYPEEFEKLLGQMDNESLTTIMNFACDTTLDVRLRARMYVQVLHQISRRKRLKMQEAKLKAKQPPKLEREGVFKIGDYIMRFPGPGAPKLTPEEAKKQREEILDAINRNAPGENPKPDAPPQNR